ncbi:MAG: hypothetical protein JOZ57_09265, partial [Abitibacteriaceae bacterium]|nr:hypothetical protein [Abditibacteriaceae bacterium]
MDKDKEKIKSSEGSGFQFGILDSEHLVWNPLVHKLYEENCHFFLIRVRRVDAFFYQTLDQYFQQAHIAASISLLSGYFDALVRVWTTPEKLKLLSTVISTSEVFLEEIREFRVQDIEYLWSTRLLQDKDLSKYRNSIETIRKQSVQGLELDQQLL